MIYYFIIFIATSFLSISILIIKNSFFSFAYSTVSLLNVMVDTTTEEKIKQSLLINKLKKLLIDMLAFIIMLSLLIVLSLSPVIIYMKINTLSYEVLDTSSFYFILSMLAGSVILFIFPLKRNKKDYSDASKFLHKLILDNYNISKSLFNLDKRLFKKKTKNIKKKFVIVSGLARAGTTALTEMLFNTGKFHSLTYSNMPFLTAVNIWSKFYSPKKNKLKERAHADKILFGFNSVEALEEYFFKIYLKDQFIHENSLTEHHIDKKVYESYLIYQSLINKNGDDSVYLAKNNNMLLRYNSLRSYNPYFYYIILFRNPLDHAYSLLKQHLHFSKLQKNDPFTLDYMNWLGHHEFGLNHKVFDFGFNINDNNYKKTSINYWLKVWINYYTKIMTLERNDKLILVDYNDLLNNPKQLIHTLSRNINISLRTDHIKQFQKSGISLPKADSFLLENSNKIYAKLIENKINIM